MSSSSSSPKPPSTSPLYRGGSMEQQPQSWLSSSLAEQQQDPRTASSMQRSSPIAIIRSPSSAAPDDDDDSSDDNDVADQEALHERMSQLTVGSLPTCKESGWSARSGGNARSMPVPRAPFLTSRQAQDRQHGVPPMALGTQNQMHDNSAVAAAASVPSYGSLRDSHLKGRFLDGPASYRDSSSGQIHRFNHARKRVVKFDDSATSYQPPPTFNNGGGDDMSSWSRQPITVTPGQRMQEALQKRQQDGEDSLSGGASPMSDKSPRETSSLAAMMEQAPKETAVLNHGNIETQQPSQEHFGQDTASHMLSASLTGLEVLQGNNGIHIQQQQQQQDSYSLTSGTTAWEHSAIRNSEPLDEAAEDEEEEEHDDVFFDHPPPHHNPDTVEAFDLDLDD